MVLDLRLFLKQLEKTEATSWSELASEVETLMYKHLEKMPDNYSPEDMLEVMELLDMIRYDSATGVFVVTVHNQH